MPPYKLLLTYYVKTKLNSIFRVALKAISWASGVELKGHFTHMKLFFKITEIETLINIRYIVRFLRSTDVSVFYY